jgi:hypothetical protein
MKLRSFTHMLLFAGGLAAFAPAIAAQNSILLLKDFPVEPSVSGVTPSSPYTFQKTIQQLNCAASPIKAKLSSTQDGGGDVLVDNYIDLTVTPSGGSAAGPVNICKSVFAPNCFATVRYLVSAVLEGATGQDPDTYIVPYLNPNHLTLDNYAGVAPIDISKYLVGGAQQVEFDLVDLGNPDSGYYANSTLYLDTNCTPAGVSGSGVVINPVPPNSNPSNPPVENTFTFNNNTNQGIQFSYTLPTGTTVPTGLVEQVSDSAVEQTAFPGGVTGTSFSPASCLLHAGELDSNGNPACKLYLLQCTTSSNSTPSGENCPAGSEDEIFGETFDPTSLPTSLPAHTGFGLLMGSDAWNGVTACTFPSGSAQYGQICPQNLLYDLSGPGSVNDNGRSTQPNSTFISVYGVPEDTTTVTVGGLHTGNWVNTATPSVSFSSAPPAGSAPFVAAPIQSIAYGLFGPLDSTVPLPANEPTLTDGVLTNPTPCPAAGSPYTASTFAPAAFPVSLDEGDGVYQLHYYAQDCAGTQELQFTYAPVAGSASYPNPTWRTSFYTQAINLDTVKPTVTAPVLSPSGGSYVLGQTVTAGYSCADDRSGVVNCGSHAVAAALSTGPLSDAVATSSLGNQTFTVTAVDAAGNQSSQSVNYTVLAALPTISFTTTATLSKSAPNYVATVKVTNTGTATATNVKLTTASLGAATGSTLPQTVGTGTLAPGAWANVTVSFPIASAGADGAAVVEKYAGTYTGGSYSASIRATLP